MRRMKKTICLIFFASVACIGSSVYANTTNMPPTAGTTSAAKTEEKKYVGITQPIPKEVIQTFDSQMNIMGEASVGTEISIIVYYGEEVNNFEEVTDKDEYKLKTVGATKTFNQLIHLREGQNNVVLSYQYADNGGKGVITIKIIRKPESEKEMIKGYMAPQAIVDKIVTSPSEEKPTTSQDTVGSKMQPPASK